MHGLAGWNRSMMCTVMTGKLSICKQNYKVEFSESILECCGMLIAVVWLVRMWFTIPATGFHPSWDTIVVQHLHLGCRDRQWNRSEPIFTSEMLVPGGGGHGAQLQVGVNRLCHARDAISITSSLQYHNINPAPKQSRDSPSLANGYPKRLNRGDRIEDMTEKMLMTWDRLTVSQMTFYSFLFTLIHSYIESRKTKPKLHATMVSSIDE